ncbi:hypothetical protein [Methanobrevibacter sp.]|uniref:hypothetical protein n=1 Tax=Methanobrevibacter sp. TaxID=66852 RepID=UPI0025F53726|nr:hypothetical protein [Methanobrevibacter sp.]MBQ2961637.1 hypothetical protein [Methanobrevibacter sp.]
MKKIFLILLCLFTVFIIAGASFASSDFDKTANNASIQLSSSPYGDLSISANMVSKDKTNPNETISIKGDLNQKNQSSAVSGNGPKLNITGPKINGNNPKIQVPKNQGILSFQSSSSGMNVAGGSAVADTGNDLIDFLDDSGTINKVSYGIAWTAVKGAELISDNDFSEGFEEYLINEVAFGDLSRFF